MKQKPIFLFDGTLLSNEFSRSNSDRSGVFFTVYNLFLNFVKQDYFEIVVYVADTNVRDAVKRACSLYGFSEVPVITENELQAYSIAVFFEPSLITSPPKSITKNRHIAIYTILYDVTPLVLPDIEASNLGWFEQLKNTLNGTDRYFCISNYTRKLFLRFFPILDEKKLFVTPLAASASFYYCTDRTKIDAVKEKYNVPKDKPYIFSLCTIQPRKNLIHAVKCFISFVEENNIDNLYFVLGGGHWDIFIKQLDEQIFLQSKWKERIIKTGYIDDKDLAPFYSDALCSVYVSLHEGFGLPILEAMQCGCPVIASGTTSCVEVIGETGITVDPYDPVELKKAYKKMYEDKLFREQCRERGLERASTFSWTVCANKMLNVIRGTYLLSQRTARAEPNRKKRKLLGMERHKNLSILRFFFVPFIKKQNFPQKNMTVLYLLNIPVAEKKFGRTCDTTKILGIPLKKTIHEGVEIRTKVLGIPLAVRPNYKNIDDMVRNFSHTVSDSIYRAVEFSQTKQQKNAIKSLQEEIEKLPFYRTIKAAEHGVLRLEDELNDVDTIVQQLMKEEADA